MESVVIPNQGVPPATNNTDGLQSIEISISEQQITEQLTFTGSLPFDILQPIRGQYLDYVFDLRVESVRQNGVLYTCECCTDIDEIFYTPLNYSLPSQKYSKWYTIDEKETAGENFFVFPTASSHLTKIANALKLRSVKKFKDFYSTVEVGEQEESGATYADLIRDIFGWSSRVPTELINVFIRNGTLYAIQRGYESNLIDISGAKMTAPIFTREFVRMYYKRSKWSKTEVEEVKSPRKDYELNYSLSDAAEEDDSGSGSGDGSGSGSGSGSDNSEPAWLNIGQITTEDNEGRTVTTYTYTKDGVLISTVAEFTSFTDGEKDTRTTTQNYYDSDGLLKRTTVETIHIHDTSENTKTVTTYGYITLDDGKKFLSTEMIEEYIMNGSNTAWELENTRVTTKSPTGRGQGAAADNQGNVSASSNIGDDRITPYSKYRAPHPKAPMSNDGTSSGSSTGAGTGTGTESGSGSGSSSDTGSSSETYSDTTKRYRDIDGLTLIDTSFPIQDVSSKEYGNSVDTTKGSGRLNELTAAIKWLNRKTKETVQITLYEFPHVIDFNDKILLFGAEYFLVSNTATTTPRVFNEQQLTLVRWF